MNASLFYNTDSNTYNIGYDNNIDVTSNVTNLIWKLFRITRTYKMYNEFLTCTEKSLFIEPYKTCNLQCSYCYAAAEQEGSDKLSYEKVKYTIDNYGITNVMIFGGDILTDPTILLRLYRDYPHLKTLISTNGTLLTQGLINAIIQANTYLQISIEPEEWNQRYSYSGVHQNRMLEDKWELISQVKNPIQNYYSNNNRRALCVFNRIC
jgi:sulfatase maturation enzyme AslB (radical SAM superfamily)